MTGGFGFAVALLVLSATAFGQPTMPASAPRKVVQEEDPKRVVYFIDASANSAPTIGPLRDQLKQSISLLTAKQEFNVVLLRQGKLATFGPKLQAANPDSKTKVYGFIDNIASQGKSSLLPLADYLKGDDADKCYILVFDGMNDVEAAMKRVKAEYKGKTTMSVIFITKDLKSPMKQEYQRICDLYGGILRIVEAEKF